ncbi:MAG: NifB/NifX family molybdenum-iron cluster-binding protein [Candidatus Sabulitectum sp.]|nr:NifB/NifX family molybdenum-iron cluster-binding protein [Candidatus Sabulitectum sp.]
MRIAIPMANGALCMHFGHCGTFAIVDVEDNKVTAISDTVPPPHQPGLLPPWLAEQGVTMVIAGGMGSRAQALFTQSGIEVVTGASGTSAREIVENYLGGTLETVENACDH